MAHDTHSRSSSESSGDIILDDRTSNQPSTGFPDSASTSKTEVARAASESPAASPSRVTVTRSIARKETFDEIRHAGSKHTQFQVLPPDDNSSTPAPPRSTPPLQHHSFENSQATDPPLFVPQVSSITHQPLDDYREPEAVPDSEVVPSYEDVWAEEAAGAWGASSPTPFHPFITNEDEDIDGPYMAAITNWWSTSSKTLSPTRPGPGHLPPVVEADLGLSSLWLPKVEHVSIPDEINEGFNLVTRVEVNNAIPHKLFYNAEKHGWSYIAHLEDPTLSLLHRLPGRPLPATQVRSRRTDCVHSDAKSALPLDSTHHYHYYASCVDSSELPEDPLGHLPPPLSLEAAGDDRMDEDVAPEPKQLDALELSERGYMLDAYVCSLCSLYVVASPIIPAIIPLDVRNAVSDRLRRNPRVGLSPQLSIIKGWELVVRILQGWVFLGKLGDLNVHGRAFQSNIGWNEDSAVLFKHLGFTWENPNLNEVETISPPQDHNDPAVRAALLRSLIELSAFVAVLRERAGQIAAPPQPPLIRVQPVIDRIALTIGSSPNQIRRGFEHSTMDSELADAYKVLGMTPDSHSERWLKFAYKQQVRCDPAGIPNYLQALQTISEHPALADEGLVLFVLTEKSKGYWSSTDLGKALSRLGFGEEGPLRISFDAEVDGTFLMNAFQEAWKDSETLYSSNPDHRDIAQRDLKDGVLIAAQSTGREELVKFVEAALKRRSRDPVQAYATLGASIEMDDEVIIAIFGLRVADEPGQQQRWLEALETIADHRNSARLKALRETGQDPGGEPQAVAKPEWPRGLHQLGNTCYLNSLLQYFYTIKDLRDVLADGGHDSAVPLKEDDLKTTLVGGRLISTHELYRSRSFVTLLNDLFVNLACAEAPAVLPEIELAKLALMTSKDEEAESQQEANGTSTGSADTDSTLVEAQIGPQLPTDAGNVTSPSSPILSPTSVSSVLGKRSGEDIEHEREARLSPMEVEDNTTDPATLDAPPKFVEKHDVDVEMQDATPSGVLPPPSNPVPPPLPPRRRTEGVGEMMFGKQNDVSECMDNCMFQIECALQFSSNRKDDEKSNVIKRLFYGRNRQQIRPTSEAGKSEPVVRVKEDIFNNLLVNVSEEGLDLYDGLGHFLDDTVEFEGGAAEMEIDILELPPILHIQLQRVQFDRDTLQAKKSNAYVKFDETLCMDRYLDAADPARKAESRLIRNKLRSCRSRIAALSQNPDTTYSQSLSNTKALLSGELGALFPEADQELNEYLDSECGYVDNELKDVRDEARNQKLALEQLWAGESNAEYELCSVFIHRGISPSFGHYFFYSRDLPNNPDQWFKYNDSEVSLVGKEEIFADTTGSTANPYLLVYARKGANVIDTVHRLLPSS